MPAELSPTMRAALDAVRTHPTTEARRLPGGTRTVEALMRRGLVEVAGEEWRVYLPEHRHEFRTTMHLDSCHGYTTAASCECGVAYQFYGERSVKADPYSVVWMDDEDECPRCKQLLAGARPRHQVVIARA